MLLKKQTVWLLTMLSLVVVLSVYYITSPEQRMNDLADTEEKAEQKNEEAVNTESADSDNEVITNAAGDEKFEALRLELNDERSRAKEELAAVMGTTDLPAEEISGAKDQIDKLDELAEKEYILETLIKAMNYEDVLVRADEKNVQVTVKAEKLSRTEANEIIRQVKSEIGDLQLVTVEFQPE
ncbi:SpoIIIAH-like family protein [Cytobacillus praedii]|uniref:SpoIIIAH-like family protein n=1 Tax=Cytobacillus praedii TaxID=1742358 RepID=A0A4R1AY94_9BACI|nr:SpoIIIAH-like family protein [Cytobacillus praedii]MED3551082.1 SpoIIIAH-like family protein [Cytobacillus praedii]MED3571689.1 SpoIIIAH-like family protein [Cytobacillus praedii]TCJ03293.1 SpoIIIAH-like family protein [Cytobacillus praedii]